MRHRLPAHLLPGAAPRFVSPVDVVPDDSSHGFPDGPEIALPAGDVTVGVVRIGTPSAARGRIRARASPSICGISSESGSTVRRATSVSTAADATY